MKNGEFKYLLESSIDALDKKEKRISIKASKAFEQSDSKDIMNRLTQSIMQNIQEEINERILMYQQMDVLRNINVRERYGVGVLNSRGFSIHQEPSNNPDAEAFVVQYDFDGDFNE